MRIIYVVRHCSATGQAPDAPLTPEGELQALRLAKFLLPRMPARLLSSPFDRAQQSISPLAQQLKLPIETDNRLCERVLSTTPSSDWFEKLRQTFSDFDLRFPGGESSREASARIISLFDEVIEHPALTTVLVTHGNLMSLLLHHCMSDFGFEQWQSLTNPDVYRVKIEGQQRQIDHIWSESLIN